MKEHPIDRANRLHLAGDPQWLAIHAPKARETLRETLLGEGKRLIGCEVEASTDSLAGEGTYDRVDFTYQRVLLRVDMYHMPSPSGLSPSPLTAVWIDASAQQERDVRYFRIVPLIGDHRKYQWQEVGEHARAQTFDLTIFVATIFDWLIRGSVR